METDFISSQQNAEANFQAVLANDWRCERGLNCGDLGRSQSRGSRNHILIQV